MKPLTTLAAATLLTAGLVLGGIGCSSNAQTAQDRDHGYTGDLAFGESNTAEPEAQQAGYQVNAAPRPAPQSSERGDTGNGAFGETPP